MDTPTTPTTVTYTVWGLDNIAYGPVELPTFVSWIKDNRVQADSWVFKDSQGTWSRASEISELRILFKGRLSAGAIASAEALGIKPGSLRRIKLLADFEDRLLGSLLPYLEIIKVPQFGTVITKGEHGDALLMVLEGEVRARVIIDGRETTLTTMGIGECFGELSVLDQGPRSADVIANEPTVLVKVSAVSLRKMFAEAPALAAPFLFSLSRVIAQRVRLLTRKYEDSIHFSRTASSSPTEVSKA